MAPIRRTQVERASQAKEKLVRAALALIAERGVDGFSIADVADWAGVSRGLPGHHFGSRDALLLAAAQRAMVLVGRHSDEGLEPLRASMSRSLERAKRPSDGLRALARFVTAANLPHGVKDHVDRYWAAAANMIRGHLEMAREQGAISSASDPAVLSGVLMGALIGQVIWATRAPACGLSDAEAQAFLVWVSTGLGNHPGKPKIGSSARGGSVAPVSQRDLFSEAEP